MSIRQVLFILYVCSHGIILYTIYLQDALRRWCISLGQQEEEGLEKVEERQDELVYRRFVIEFFNMFKRFFEVGRFFFVDTYGP